MNHKKLVENIVELRDQKKEYEDLIKHINTELEKVEQALIEVLVQEGIGTIKFPGLATITTTIKAFPRIIDKTQFYAYLRDSGQDGLIQETVNANTLRAWWNSLAGEKLAAERIGLAVWEKPALSVRKG